MAACRRHMANALGASTAGVCKRGRAEAVRMGVTRRRGGLCILAVAALLLFERHAVGQPLRVVESQPPAGGVVDRRPAQYFVRFAGPVDHYRASLVIARQGQVVAVLHPRLDAAPELLFGTAPALEPGAYELRWAVTSQSDGEVTRGVVAFTVRSQRE
jgi:methionine-rich copper-binding protein CopC